jgi:hypothetical protein
VRQRAGVGLSGTLRMFRLRSDGSAADSDAAGAHLRRSAQKGRALISL